MKNTRTFRFTCYGFIAAVIVTVSTFTFLRPIFIIRKPQDMTLTITATGKKQTDSFGTEVRIKGIKVNQSQNIDLKGLPKSPGWKMDGDLLVAYGVTDPASISMQLSKFTSIDIDVIKQRGSGIAEIQIGDRTESVDLFADEDWKTDNWHYEVPGEFKPFARLDLLLGLWVVTFLLIWGFIYWIKNKE